MAKRVKEDIIAQKNARQVSLEDQKEAPSSIENSTPPMGAPKAAATPAAAPQAIKSRFSASFLNSCTNILEIVWSCPEPSSAWETMSATAAPLWIMGPSLPTGKLPPTENMMPRTLPTRVRKVVARGILMPLSTHLTSGMPEPAAVGSKHKQNAQAQMQ
jgi:hypothetical protein